MATIIKASTMVKMNQRANHLAPAKSHSFIDFVPFLCGAIHLQIFILLIVCLFVCLSLSHLVALLFLKAIFFRYFVYAQSNCGFVE